MTVLSNIDIKQYLKKGIIKIKPLKEEQIGPASVDLTLSNEWYFFKEEYIGKTIDLSKKSYKELIKGVKADNIILRPGEMCMGKTLEKITIPNNIIGMLEGRSRYARIGLTAHVTASLVQPGCDNHQVLEIVNLSPFTVVLHKGMRISQISFDLMESATDKPYKKYGKIARNQ